MSVAAADRLHVLAHRAAASGRTVEDWWGSPVETALAAVAMARHSRAYRNDAEHTLERLLRWWRDEQPRRISADVTALALTARAAAELQRSAPDLVAAAADAVDDLARRDRSVVPELHLALCVWALDGLIPQRDAAPWPELRTRLDRPRLAGVDEPLRRFAVALAQPFDANTLVQDLLGEIGASPGLSESCVLLWLITAAGERLVQTLPHDDNALQVLLRRRAELVDRLAGDVDETTFVEPELGDFAADAADAAVVNYLSRFEALLLDVALAASDEATPWLTFTEAEELFGERERAALGETVVTRRKLLRWTSTLVAALALVGGFALWLGLRAIDWKSGVVDSLAITLAAAVLVVAVAIWRRTSRETALADSWGIFFALLALLAGANAINQHLKKPVLSDVVGLVVSTAIAAAAAIIWQIAVRVFGTHRQPSS